MTNRSIDDLDTVANFLRQFGLGISGDAKFVSIYGPGPTREGGGPFAGEFVQILYYGVAGQAELALRELQRVRAVRWDAKTKSMIERATADHQYDHALQKLCAGVEYYGGDEIDAPTAINCALMVIALVEQFSTSTDDRMIKLDFAAAEAAARRLM